jgi:hypothetical protein
MPGHDESEGSGNPSETAAHESIFKWATMREVGPWTLGYAQPVHGKAFEVELTSGHKVQVFRADDGLFYFCHGLTFGGKQAPGGAVSPFSGEDVRTILDNHYQPIEPESGAVRGDVLVWTGIGGDTPHSAILSEPVVRQGTSYLDYASRVWTKNGRLAEAEMSLGRLTGDEFSYGDSFTVYRRKKESGR